MLVLLVKNLQQRLLLTALKRAPKDAAQTGVLRQYASDVARGAGLGGVTELGTELVQEGALVGLRANLDDTFTAGDAQLHLTKAAFAGFFGGASLWVLVQH